jgi:hypothetical protein
MERRSVEALVRGLNEGGVRYLIVGGLAVAAHGVLRFTVDVDIVLDFDPENLRRATTALGGLGYRPRAPVPLEQFSDESARRSWVREKGLTVFSLFSPEHGATEVDLFVEAPFDFDAAHARATRIEIASGVSATFVSRGDLIEMKRQAGRPQDLEDVRRLEGGETPGAQP